MKILVLAEIEFDALRPASLAAVHCARQLAGESGGSVTWLLLGHNLDAAAADAARFGEVLCVDDPALATCSADTWAPAIARAVEQEQADMILAGSSLLDLALNDTQIRAFFDWREETYGAACACPGAASPRPPNHDAARMAASRAAPPPACCAPPCT